MVKKYQLLDKRGEGTFSEVRRGVNRATGEFVAVKCLKKTFATVADVLALPEVTAARQLVSHPHLLLVNDVLYDPGTGRAALVFDLMGPNLYEHLRESGRPMPLDHVRTAMRGLVEAVAHMHEHGVIHRDVKPENILLTSSAGQEPVLKLADLGSSRQLDESSQRPPAYTEYISTRWYRSPETLLTSGHYDGKLDVWGLGCVMFEMMTGRPLFPGESEADQLRRIHEVTGAPSQAMLRCLSSRSANCHPSSFGPHRGTGLRPLLPRCAPSALDLLSRMLQYDPARRCTAEEALLHPFLTAALPSVRNGKSYGKAACPARRGRDPRKGGVASPVSAGNQESATRKTPVRRSSSMFTFDVKSEAGRPSAGALPRIAELDVPRADADARLPAVTVEMHAGPGTTDREHHFSRLAPAGLPPAVSLTGTLATLAPPPAAALFPSSDSSLSLQSQATSVTVPIPSPRSVPTSASSSDYRAPPTPEATSTTFCANPEPKFSEGGLHGAGCEEEQQEETSSCRSVRGDALPIALPEIRRPSVADSSCSSSSGGASDASKSATPASMTPDERLLFSFVKGDHANSKTLGPHLFAAVRPPFMPDRAMPWRDRQRRGSGLTGRRTFRHAQAGAGLTVRGAGGEHATGFGLLGEGPAAASRRAVVAGLGLQLPLPVQVGAGGGAGVQQHQQQHLHLPVPPLGVCLPPLIPLRRCVTSPSEGSTLLPRVALATDTGRR